MTGEELNTNVKNTVKAALTEGKNNPTHRVAADMKKYSKEKVFGINRINLVYLEWHFEQSDRRKPTKVNN